jgi:outer membrane murein-binding lipoprotein Lpp
LRRPIRTALILALSLLGAAIVAPVTAASSESPSPVTEPGLRAQFDRASDEITTLAPQLRQPHASLTATATHAPPAQPSAARAAAGAIAKATPTVVQKVWVSVASATAKTSDDVNTGMTEAAIKNMISYVNSYWAAQSNNAVSFVFGGYETRSLGQSTCDANAALADEEAASFGGQFSNGSWAGTKNHLLVLTRESCGAQSFATVSTDGGEIFSGNGIGASMGEPYLLHEFGHNLGFAHADGTICASSTSYDASIASYGFSSTKCPTTEYDDYLDIMGYTVHGATPNVSSVQRILSGWMTNYASVNGGAAKRTITLMPLGSSGGTQSIVITDPASGEQYYVEYRAPIGRDKTSAEFNYQRQCGAAHSGYSICNLGSSAKTGIIRVLRALPVGSADGTAALALTKVSGSSVRRATSMAAGATFTNFDRGFQVKINSLSITHGASVTVTLSH